MNKSASVILERNFCVCGVEIDIDKDQCHFCRRQQSKPQRVRTKPWRKKGKPHQRESEKWK